MRNKKKLSKLTKLLITIFAIVSFYPILHLAKTVAKAGTTDSFTVTAAKSSGDYFTADDSGTILVTIKANGLVNQTVTLTLAIRDCTAVSEAGDYYLNVSDSSNTTKTTAEKASETHELKTYTFTDVNPTITLSFTTVAVDYSTNVNNVDNVKYFVIEFLDVIGTEMPAKTEYKCGLTCSTYLKTSHNSNGYYLREYDYDKTRSVNFPEFDDDEEVDQRYNLLDTYTSGSTTITRSDVINNIVNNGLGYIYASCNFYGDAHVFNLARCTWTFYFEKSNKSFAIWSHKSVYEDWYWVDNLVNNYWSSGDGNEKYFQFPADNEDYIRIHGKDETEIDRYGTAKWHIKISDIKKAECIGSYIDASTIKYDGKIRAILRFNEPIQLTDTSLVSIIGSLNSMDEIKFDYETGNYTDTLVFTTNINDSEYKDESMYIHNIHLDTFENVNTVCDLGHNITNKNLNNYYDADETSDIFGTYATVKCGIDLREPRISSASIDYSNISTKSKNVNVQFQNISEAVCYYTWSTNKDQTFNKVEDYDASIDLVGDDNDSANKIFTIDSVTGEYYLHLCVVNKFGKKLVETIGRGNKGSADGGGLLLDNTAPSNPDVEVLTNTLTSKSFAISSKDGTNSYDSGVETVYISIKSSEDSMYSSDTPIWTTNSVTAKEIPSDNKTAFRSDVYKLNDDVMKVTSTAKSGISVNNYKSGGSMMFSSYDIAKQYLEYKEYQDFQVVTVKAGDPIIETIGSHLASGEVHAINVNETWILYKQNNFDYKTFQASDYKDSDWVYYYYGGSATQLDVAKALENALLKQAVENNAKTLANQGSTVNLIDINSTKDGLPYVPTDRSLYAQETINSTISAVMFKNSYNIKDNALVMSSSGGELSVLLEAGNEVIDCGEGTSKIVYIGFYTEDSAGNSNKSSITYKKYKYDTRDLFDCEFTDTNATKATNDLEESNCYYISNCELQFKALLKADEQGSLEIASIKYAGNTLTSTQYKDYFEYSVGNNGILLTFIPKVSGYCELELNLVYNSTAKKHDIYTFYFTDNKADNTLNYTNQLDSTILKNSVFAISTQYKYMTSDGKIVEENYAKSLLANNSTLSVETVLAYFSDSTIATSYIRYMEMQDLYLVVLTDGMATSLNQGGSVSYSKAPVDEKITASAGQVWIRYKINTWTPKSMESGWVYYYGGDNIKSLKIEPSKLTSSLNSAITAVVNKIISLGSTVNLVGINTDDEGLPYAPINTLHIKAETATKTKNGSVFSTLVSYNGDNGMYDSKIKQSVYNSNDELSIVTNTQLVKQENTKIYYAYYKQQPYTDLVFKELKYTAGQKYKEVIDGTTGVYFIREYDDNGLREYKVYLDVTSPMLSISYTTPNAQAPYTRVLDSSSNGLSFGCKTFTIGNINTVSELDKYSYISIYEGGKLKKTYFASDLAKSNITLDSGSFVVFVSDRSGNGYSFSVDSNSSELHLDVSIEDGNDCVRVEIDNRSSDEIYRYQVFLNGEETPIDDDWSTNTNKTKRYYESGYYYIYVQDIYGNVREEKGEGGTGLSYERAVPEVIWSYLDSDDSSFIPYTSTSTAMSMYKSLGNTYYISTSRPLKIRMNTVYPYKLEGLSESVLTKMNSNHDILFTTAADWKANHKLPSFAITFYYEDYPEIQVKYIITCDIDSPDINLTYKCNNWVSSEEQLFQEINENATVGSIYELQNLGYANAKEVLTCIGDQAVVNSKLIKLNVTDISGVKSVDVYLTEGDGVEKLFNTYTAINGEIENVTLSRYGKYRIVASDVFNNVNELSFTNIALDRVEYSVDNKNIDLLTESTLYGNTSSTIKMLDNGTLTIKVTDENDKSYVLILRVEDGKAIKQQYICCEYYDDGDYYKGYELKDVTIEERVSMTQINYLPYEIFSSDDTSYANPNTWYKVLSKTDDYGDTLDGFDLYVSKDTNLLLSFKVVCPNNNLTVEYRASFTYDIEPYYYKAELSKELTDIDIYNKDGELIDTSEVLSYTNQTFRIDENLDTNITKIEFAYSDNNDFREYKTLYPYTKVDEDDTRTFGTYNATLNGFYCIKITNKYGNVNVYTINRSDVFTVLVETIHKDGLNERLKTDYEGDIKSDNAIIIEAYSKDVIYIIKSNSSSRTVNGYFNGSYNELTFSDSGEYTIEVKDLVFGNVITKHVFINKSGLTYNDDLLSGYNQRALKLDEGYTNQLLTIDYQTVQDLSISYIAYEYDNELHIIYDKLNKVGADLNGYDLNKAIGKLGDGVYKVIFRNAYGSKVVKEIHYKGTSTLVVSRRVNTSTIDTMMDLGDVIANGAYSNGSITFDSSAELYEFSVDGLDITFPKTVAFAATSGNGTISYQIYYRDEYGYEYAFVATLDRKTITINLDEKVESGVVDEYETTSDPVSLSFSAGECVYTLNGGEQHKYIAGTKLYKDGLYRFVVTDKAGNTASYLIIRDSICDYTFLDKDNGNAVLIDGQAVNSKEVVLTTNDNVKITKIYKDNVRLEDIDSTHFYNHGHYYVFLEDPIGNSSVFEFTILSHQMNSFHYVTPNTYHITTLWYSGNNGEFSDYMNSGCVIQNTNNSEFTINDNGDYQVIMTSTVYNSGISFSFTINNKAPKVTLSGCEEHEKTVEDVTFLGCVEGDTIYIYNDGELVSTYEVNSSLVVPTISSGGHYKIVVKNIAGVETVLEFTRIGILNTSGSVLVIIACLAVVGGIVIGVVLKNKQKFDE